LASAFTHGFVGLALGRLFTARKMPARFWVLSALCGILPDVDAIGHMLGVEYASLWGHRGLVHSLLFAAIIGIAVAWAAFDDPPRLSKRWWLLALYFFVVTASHGVLDAMTTGGLGVAFFSPFDTARYFFPWRPIRVSPIGVASFFSWRGLRVLASELLWVWAPMAVALCGAWAVRRRKRDEGSGGRDEG
jgi:inner membrane protein